MEQAALFYEFSFERHVSADHLLRSTDRFVDLSSIREHLRRRRLRMERPLERKRIVKFFWRFPLAVVAPAILLMGPAMAVEPQFPVVPGYGGIRTAPEAAERPDKTLRYRAVLNVTKAAGSPDKVNPSLEKVARFLNLLGQDGVRPGKGDIVAIVHGPATPLVLSDAVYRSKNGGQTNPNLELVRQLRAAGVEIHVCSQALAGQGIPAAAVDKMIQVDVAALTTLANLQLRGYALIPE